jgi:hypothetical protein
MPLTSKRASMHEFPAASLEAGDVGIYGHLTWSTAVFSFIASS